MKNNSFLLYLLILFVFISCRKQSEDIKVFEPRIISASLDKVIIPDTTKIIRDTVKLDLNRDNKTDYLFIYEINQPYSSSDFVAYAIALNSNELLFNMVLPGYNYINALSAGEYFYGNWGTYYGELVNPPLATPWENTSPKYLGFRIKVNDKFYTGWIKMEIGKKGSKIIFYDYAYRLDNSNHMYAGER